MDDVVRILEEVAETSRGYKIYREGNEVGGHRYWSDAIGGGVVIWDTSLASPEELETVLKIERKSGQQKLSWVAWAASLFKKFIS